jgi:outer membrane protein OmpA-like peptidoglycan-associated protein
MSDEWDIRQFRLFGEDAPGWFIWELILLGLAGFVATAHLLAPSLEKELIPHYLGQVVESGGSQGQPAPVRRDTTFPGEQGANAQQEPVPDKPGTGEAVTIPAERAELETGSKPSGSIAVSTSDVTDRDSLASQDNPPLSKDLAASLGPMPDLLAELRLPRPIPESSASEEALDGTLGPDSEYDQGSVSDAKMRQPTGGIQRESSSQAVSRDHTASASDGGSQTAAAAAALSGQADATPSDCVPVFMATFPSGGVEPAEYDLASKVKRLADWLRRYPAAKVFIEGHADGVGDEEFNLVLSHRRAKAVGELLVQAGVPRAQLSTRAYGESMLADPSPRSGRNRRVSIRVAAGGKCLPMVDDYKG